MAKHRLVRVTNGRERVTPTLRTAARLGVLVLGAVLWAPAASAGEEAVDVSALLRRAARSELPLSQRLEAVQGAMEAERLEAAGTAVRAAASLMKPAPEPAAWLLKRAVESDWVNADTRAAAGAAIRQVCPCVDPPAKGDALYVAALLLVGEYVADGPVRITMQWPPSAFVASVLDLEVGGDWRSLSNDEAREMLRKTWPVIEALNKAASDDPAVMQDGMARLVKAGAAAVPLLTADVRRAARTPMKGRTPRATRAALALGAIKDRRATPVLIEGMQSENGWLRTYCATALGDLGDPAAVFALARQFTLLGDPLRDRDQWDYPGPTNTNIAADKWDSIEYYVIDTAAADSLLRLGVAGAAGWIINFRLNPRAANYRIRLYQDAVDAIRRSVPSAPIEAFNVDDGIPLRSKGFEKLALWWHAHRHDEGLTPNRVDTSDAGFQAAAQGFADTFRRNDVREIMSARATCIVLGSLATDALIEAAQTTENPRHKMDIARALGLVSDPQAVPALIGLARTKSTIVRAAAAEGLGAYAGTSSEALDVLLKLLKGRAEAPRVAALQALVRAPRSALVLNAVKAAGDAGTRSSDYDRAESVVLFVQEGEAHWPTIEAGLRAKERVLRRTWWDLLRHAVELPDYFHEPVVEPGAPGARHVTREQALNALEARLK